MRNGCEHAMSDQEYLVGKCSKCGEELRVPARLEHFSCMFCGAKLTPQDLVTELTPVELDGDPEELMRRVCTDLIRCITDHPGLHKKISRREYEPAFLQYEQACRSVFEDLDTACRIEPERQSERIAQAVTAFLDQLEQVWMQNKDWKLKYKQTLIRDDDKMTIAIFMVPMVGHLGLSISQEFCDTLQRHWVERNPKSPFYVGSYDAISGGFRKRFKLCFITTAVCEELGKPDDCAELTAFRAFRDGYLMSCPDGPALVEEYYDIAPGIVTCINHCGDRAARYSEIRDRYLGPCYEDLLAGRPEACKLRYIRMVRELQKQYLS